jgi:DNA-binding beta-propeller fold protein YncE
MMQNVSHKSARVSALSLAQPSRWGGILAGFLIVASTLPRSAEAEAEANGMEHFKVTQSTPIGGEGSWDYAAYDPRRHRLFVARVGGTLVLDADPIKAAATIPARAGTRTHGVALAEDLGIGMTSNGTDQTSTVFELGSLTTLRQVSLGISPDNIVYDPFSHDAVAFDGDENLAVVFDPKTGEVAARIKLPGSPEGAAVDGRGRLYVNLSDASEIAAIDTHTWSVQAHWSIGGSCKDPTPLAMDESGGRLFSACRSGFLAIVDPRTQKLLSELPIGKGADSVAFDVKSHLIFVSCYDGTLAIVQGSSPTRFEVMQTVATAPAARTLALDPAGPRLFLPVADLGPMLPKVGDLPARPAVVPSTFRILTIRKSGGSPN